MNERCPAVVIGKEMKRGVYCSFYELPEEPQRFAKKANTTRSKTYLFGLTIRFPLARYVRMKYGIGDIIRYEYDRLQQFPEELRDYLLKNVTLEQSTDGEPVLCADRVFDFDGVPSQSLVRVGKIANPLFWEAVARMCDILESHRIYLFHVFRGGNQILVQKLSPDRWKPVILDTTKVGRVLYPFQFHLFFEYFLRRKFERGLHRFIARFKAGV